MKEKKKTEVMETVKVQSEKPKFKKYTVKPGDTLESIAEMFLDDRSKATDIMYASGIVSDKIRVKQVLYIPIKERS